MESPHKAEDALPQRLGLIAMGIILLALSMGPENTLWRDGTLDHTMTAAARTSLATTALIMSGSGLLLLACSLYRRVSARINLLAFAVILLVVLLNTASIFVAVRPYGSDNAAVPPYAAELFVHGRNPYRDLTIPAALEHYRMPQELLTRLTDGTPAVGLVYPAGSFLALAPFVAAGMQDVRPVYAFCLLVMMTALYAIAAPRYKVPVLAALLLHYAFATGHISGGLAEPLWGLAVFGSWFVRRRVFAASGLLGAAITVKQQGGFFLPYYLILVYRTDGLRKAVAAFLVAFGIFALTNLPFLLDAPEQWTRQVAGLGLLPLPAMGVGPATTMAMLWPEFPNTFLMLLALAFLGGTLVWCFLTPRLPARAVWVLPLMSLWFSNRSLSSYFYLIPLFALATLLSEDGEDKSTAPVVQTLR